MPKHYACNANYPEGEPIEPINRKRVQEGRHYVPDCPDYDPKFGLARRVKLKTVYTGWSCWNCTHLMESSEPFTGPKYESFTAQRTIDSKGRGAPAPEPPAAAKPFSA